MPEQILELQYRCLQSCQASCKEGELTIEASEFDRLSEAYPEENVFKSPDGVCLMAYPQRFKVLEDEVVEEDDTVDDDFDDPIETLLAEHQEILDDIKILEGKLLRRDLEGVKEIMVKLERDVVMHSLIKEEKALFPAIEGLRLNAAPVPIMEEEHRETGMLISNLWEGLEEGDIRDGMADAIMANLRNHIRKEDEEFFSVLEEKLGRAKRKEIADAMEEVEQLARSGKLK